METALTVGMVSVRLIRGSRCALILPRLTVTMPFARPGVQGVEGDPSINTMVHLTNAVPAGIGTVTTTLSALVVPSFLTVIA